MMTTPARFRGSTAHPTGYARRSDAAVVVLSIATRSAGSGHGWAINEHACRPGAEQSSAGSASVYTTAGPSQACLSSNRLRTITDPGCRLASTAASLLVTLHNPLNVTLLTSQLLLAPSFWNDSTDLQTCLRVMGLFQSAAMHILRREREALASRNKPQLLAPGPPQPKDLPKLKWIEAVLNGADRNSPRWRHLCAIAGLLIGFEGQNRRGLERDMRHSLQKALVNAANLALKDVAGESQLGRDCIALTLNYAFELLPDIERARIDYDASLAHSPVTYNR
ncbi:hypothetical protein MRB53_039416 [Persea americana]|nr:hypothetical protein MRB53_039416 [Persea americana]